MFLVKYYNICPERIFIISLRPALSIKNFSLDNINSETNSEIKRKYNLPQKYIYYPAMYLPHKNHRIIIDVIKKPLIAKNNWTPKWPSLKKLYSVKSGLVISE